MRRHDRALVLLLFGALLLLSTGAFAQDPILTYSVLPSPLTLPAGAAAEVQLRFENGSVYEADDIAASWIGSDAFETLGEPETIEILGAFESATLSLVLAASGDSVGEHTGVLQILYTYCIGELCYQIVESIEWPIVVEAAVPETVGDGTQTVSVIPVADVHEETPFPWPWLGFAVAIVCIGGVLGIARLTGRRRIAVIGLAVVLAGGLAYGIASNQHEQAQAIGSVLCISCVGLEEAHPASEVSLSQEAVAALGTLDEDVELTVFYAQWCHSCPFAERMVERMAEVSDRISYRFVNVDDAPEEAAASGIVESGRTIVPAVVRAGLPDVLFGIEDLEARLLELLGVGG